MSIEIITWLKSKLAEFESAERPTIKVVENDIKAIGAAALSYVEKNGLQALYAIAAGVLTSIATGTPWGTVLATVVTQGEAAGIQIAVGAEAVVVAQAQADLLAQGALLNPVSGAAIPAPVNTTGA